MPDIAIIYTFVENTFKRVAKQGEVHVPKYTGAVKNIIPLGVLVLIYRGTKMIPTSFYCVRTLNLNTASHLSRMLWIYPQKPPIASQTKSDNLENKDDKR